MARPCPICPACRQPIREMRLGVWLPYIKAAIFDAIKAAGDVGISSRELVQTLERPRRPEVVKSHVCQINDILEETDWRIVASGRGSHNRWILVKGHLINGGSRWAA